MDLILNRRTVILILLAGATALSWMMGHETGFDIGVYAGCSVILLAMIKIRYVMLEFMELRGAPMAIRVTAETWTIVVCTTLLGLYLKGNIAI
jgi:hypothetical protein